MKKSFLIFLLGITLLLVALAFFCSSIYYQKMYLFIPTVLFGVAGLVVAIVGWDMREPYRYVKRTVGGQKFYVCPNNERHRVAYKDGCTIAKGSDACWDGCTHW